MTHFKIYMKSGVVHLIKASKDESIMTPLKFIDSHYFSRTDDMGQIRQTKWLVFGNHLTIDSTQIEGIERIKNHFDFKELE